LLASKDSKHASYAQLLHTVVYFSLMAWPWVLVALCSMILLPELDVVDQGAAYPRMIVMILPVGLRGLLVAALMAAFISTISTLFNWGSSYLVNDIYRRFINPNATEKNYVTIARFATIFMAVAGAYISFQAENINQLLTLAYVLGSAGVMPGVMRWLWWRTTGKGELAALIVSWIMTILLMFVKAFDAPAVKLLGLEEGVLLSSDPDLVGARMLLMVISVGLACVIGSLLTKPEDMNQLKHFAMRAKPFAFGWRPVISQMETVYVEQEPLGRTLISWAIALVAVISLLVGTGKLLLGSPLFGLVLILIGAVAVVLTIRRISQDCVGDVDQSDFLKELEPHDS
jgi:Na+/proline symporter